MIDMYCHQYPITLMCAALQVARSGFYAWLAKHRQTKRARVDAWLLAGIRAIQVEWRGILGYRRMCQVLRVQLGIEVGERRVRRLMHEKGICGIPVRKRHSKPSPVDDDTPDLVRRKFQTQHPNEVWVTDLTEIKTAEGKLWLCIIKDLYDGVVVAWRTGVRQTKELVIATVDSAVATRLDGEHPILHSDHGPQYTSQDYRACLERHGLSISMGRVRTAADNASAESVFGVLKREIVHRTKFQTREEAKKEIDRYFMNLFNPLRRAPLRRTQLPRKDKLEETMTKEGELFPEQTGMNHADNEPSESH